MVLNHPHYQKDPYNAVRAVTVTLRRKAEASTARLI